MSQNYEILGQIGCGNSGVVYECRKKDTGEVLVMKKIGFSLLSQAEIDATTREVELLSKSNHENIVRYYESFMDESNNFCIVMENCSGGDLGKTIEGLKQTNSALKENDALIWFTQLCSAIRHLHNNCILHRDLKPSNVYLSSDFKVKLGDFGISKYF